MARKPPIERATRRGVRKVRRPMRQAAISTIANTAGLSTANTDANSGSCPQSA